MNTVACKAYMFSPTPLSLAPGFKEVIDGADTEWDPKYFKRHFKKILNHINDPDEAERHITGDLYDLISGASQHPYGLPPSAHVVDAAYFNTGNSFIVRSFHKRNYEMLGFSVITDATDERIIAFDWWVD